MKRLWAVTEGSYSDYHVQFVTEDKRLAKAAVDIGAGDAVEELAVLDALPVKVVIHRAGAWVDQNGARCDHHGMYGSADDDEVRGWSFTEWDFEDEGRTVTSRPKVRQWTCGCSNRCTGLQADSTDLKASIKACADTLGQLKAERLGVA